MIERMSRTRLRPWAAAVVALAGCSAKTPPPAGDAGRPGWTRLAWVRLAHEDSARFGAQVVTLSKSPPAGLGCAPAAAGRELLWSEFRLGREGSRRLTVALDTGGSEGETPVWRLFVDRDLDGDLSDEEELRAAPREARGARVARFPAVDVARPGGGRHAVSVSVLVSAGWSAAEMRSACALAGKVELFGAVRDCVVYDADADALFGGTPEAPDRLGDAIWLDVDGDGRAGEGEVRALAPRLLFGRRAVSVEVSDPERSARIEETPVAFGRLRRAGAPAGEELEVQLFSREWGILPPSSAEAPQGDWRLLAYKLVRTAADGKPWTLAGAWLAAQAPRVELGPRGAELAFGPPLEARAWVRYGRMVAPGGAHAEAAPGASPVPEALLLVTLRGASGEQARVAPAGSAESWGEFRVRDASGRELGSGKLEAMGLLPGAAGARWSPPGDLAKGAELRIAVAPDLGPFSEGYKGESVHEFGRAAPVQLVVSGVEPGSQAAAAGVRPGDILLRYDGKRIDSPLELAMAMKDAQGKPRVELVVLRQGTEYVFPLAPGRIGVETVLAMP